MDIPRPILDRLHAMGIDQLYPPQERALREAMPGRNIVVAIPTAAGKTLIAEVLMVSDILFNKGSARGKAIYLTPLKALATEKRTTFQQNWGPLAIKVAIATGDFDRVDASLFSDDIIVMTNEKVDSILRTRPDLLQGVTCVVCDEIHLLNDETRGVTLEMVLTKLMKIAPNARIVGLSATINNANQVAEWLGATLVQDNWRPVALKEGVFLENKIFFADGSERVIVAQLPDPLEALVVDTIQSGGQVLAFLSTRRNAMSAAKKIAGVIAALLTPEAREDLKALAGEFLSLEGDNTHQAVQLEELLRCGVAFHHAGLTYPQRTFIEDLFRQRKILAIAATPTLAAGINTPARRVIIKGLDRFSSEKGNQAVSVIEYKQMAGRAGRPGFDPYGEAVVIAKNPTHQDELMEKYLRGTPEDISSKLNNEKELKAHVLGVIASGFAGTWEDLLDFFHLTFFSFQKTPKTPFSPNSGSKTRKNGGITSETPPPEENYFQYITQVEEKTPYLLRDNPKRSKNLEGSLQDAIGFLLGEKMLEDTDRGAYEVSNLGRKICQLYIKPESAIEFRSALRVISQRMATHDIKVTALTFLHIISRLPDSYLPYVAAADKEPLSAFFAEHDKEFVFPQKLHPEIGDLEGHFAEIKLSAILYRWIREVSEDKLAKDFNVGAGDVRRFVDTAEWLMHAMAILSDSFHAGKWVESLQRLEVRIRFGCGEDLVPLVSIPNVGRVRGRILLNQGYKTPEDVLNANSEKLSQLPTFGPGIVSRIKDTLASGSLKKHFPTKISISIPKDKPEKNVKITRKTRVSTEEDRDKKKQGILF